MVMRAPCEIDNHDEFTLNEMRAQLETGLGRSILEDAQIG
jgi:hypothetical protein